ncbi:MAG: hypothetical protein AB1449_07130 [Chloroflexota bacterium]
MPVSPPRYSILIPTALAIGLSLLAGKRRSFLHDSQAFVRRLRPPPEQHGTPWRGSRTGYVVVANHYHSPTFRSWWIALTLTAILGEEVHWVMSDAWTYPDRLRSRLVSPATRRVFRRLAHMYGFTSMPPMPPRPWEVKARARSVLEVLAYIRQSPRPVLGLVPEGSDTADGAVMRPPLGVGRFLSLLVRAGLPLLPAGVYEADDRLHIRWGTPIHALPAVSGTAAERDRRTADSVMQAIAACLPSSLRGPYP